MVKSMDKYETVVKKGEASSLSDAISTIASRLKKNHGTLLKVSIDNDRNITLSYQDRTKIKVEPRVRNPEGIDLGMMDFGYVGTHPDCFYQFLMENDYDITKDQIANIKPPWMMQMELKTEIKKQPVPRTTPIEDRPELVSELGTDPEKWIKRGLILMDNGKYYESIGYFQKALTLNPSHPKVKEYLKKARQLRDSE
jgi:tetratricopeptide (TPR) repeat protein